MKKFIIALLCLFVITLIAIAAALVVFSPNIVKKDGNVTAEAIRIALNDHSIKGKVIQYFHIYEVVSAEPATVPTEIEFGKPFFKNVSGDIYNVRLHFSMEFIGIDNYLLTVNVSDRTVIGRFHYNARSFPASASVTMPPGAYWGLATASSNWGDSQRTTICIDTEPQDATLYPIILDGDNYRRFMNGEGYAALSYFDDNAGGQAVYDGNVSVSDGWCTHVMTKPGTGIYLIIRNGDDLPVHIDYLPNIY